MQGNPKVNQQRPKNRNWIGFQITGLEGKGSFE